MAPLSFVIRFEREGYEDAALALARRLFARFDERIDALTLVPIPEDDFALYLDGALVRSQRQSGEAPRVADILVRIPAVMLRAAHAPRLALVHRSLNVSRTIRRARGAPR